MDYSNLTLMSMMKRDMGYLSQKQDVLAQNIANADVPGYTAKELQPLNFESMANASHHLQMMTTSSLDVTNHADTAGFTSRKQKKTFEVNPTKNNVVLEEQMAQVSMNVVNYNLVTDLYKKYDGLFKTALGTK